MSRDNNYEYDDNNNQPNQTTIPTTENGYPEESSVDDNIVEPNRICSVHYQRLISFDNHVIQLNGLWVLVDSVWPDLAHSRKWMSFFMWARDKGDDKKYYLLTLYSGKCMTWISSYWLNVTFVRNDCGISRIQIII